MKNYQFPVDKDGLLLFPFRTYLDEVHAYNQLYNCNNGQEVKKQLLEKYWQEKYPHRPISELHSSACLGEDAMLYLNDEKFKHAREKFIKDWQLTRARQKLFEQLHPEDTARIRNEREKKRKYAS